MARERRFYRGKNPSIVWDGRNDRQLCDLSSGHFTTSDEYIIERLQKEGYIEIALNAVQPPPPGMEPIQVDGMVDVKPVPIGMGEKGVAALQAASANEDEYGPEVEVPKPKKKKKKSPQLSTAVESKKAPEKKSERSLKRRKK